MPLDSDVANGDSQLHVEFYERQVELPNNGGIRPTPYVRIMIPGDKTNIIDQPVRDDHKRRFPRQFLYFQMKNAPESAEVGTPLEDWNSECPDELTTGQLEELRILKFRTVEQIRGASDGQLQKVGMGASGLRDRARMYLARKNSTEADQKIANLEAMVAQLSALVTKSEAPQATQDEPQVPAAAVVAEKRKPGRPAKVQ